MHLYDSLSKPVIFAHRGASKYAPENTLTSFDLAIQFGAQAIELDTMLSSDGIPLVIHDHTLMRTTNGKGKVNEKTAEEIRALDAGIHFSSSFQGEKVPLLSEVLVRYQVGILLNIELKNYHTPHDDLARIVLDMVEQHGMLDRVLFSSFLIRNLKKLRAIQPKVKVALLMDSEILAALYQSCLFQRRLPEIIHPHYSKVTEEYIAHEHQRQRCINVWTVDEPIKAKELMNWGVDGIITNDPQGISKLKYQFFGNSQFL